MKNKALIKWAFKAGYELGVSDVKQGCFINPEKVTSSFIAEYAEASESDTMAPFRLKSDEEKMNENVH